MEPIRICAFGVRDDEAAALKSTANALHVSLKSCSDEPTIQSASQADGCIGVTVSGPTYVGKELLDLYKKMGIRYLSTRTRGYDHIDANYARQIGIRVSYASYPPESVAEFTIMLILICLRNYKQQLWRGQVNDFDLNGLQGRNLGDLTVGILGTGQIGAQVIRCLSGFGCRVIAYDPYPSQEVTGLASYVDLETVYRESDVISLHLPLLPDTRHMINQDSLAKMKDGIVLINCARGELADTESLIKGIESGKIGALGLDVVEHEEGIIHGDHRIDILAQRNLFYLRQFRNVAMTPHMAFFTNTSVESMVRCGIENICKMAAGRPCREEVKE